MADPDSSDDDDLFGDHVDSPGTFGFLANQTSDILNDEEELLPDQFHDPNYMAPADALLAHQLLTTTESKSAYRLQKCVNIADNAPIIFADTKNDNEPIIDYNKLLSTVDIQIPESIILYSSNDTDIAKPKHNDDNDPLLSESFWQKEFEKKSQLMKQTVLQTDDSQYKNLKYEYDFHHDRIHTKQPLISKVIRNDCYDIKIEQNQFKNVCNELKQSNPSLFTDKTHQNGMDDKAQLRAQNLLQWMGYNENNESELLAIDPHNIKCNNTDMDLTRLLERNQCDFDKEIIIDDVDIDEIECHSIQSSQHDTDVNMEDITHIKQRKEPQVIDMKVVNYKTDTETFLRSKYETKQRLDQLQHELHHNEDKASSLKRKNRENEDDSLLFHAAKRQKHCRKSIQFKMTTNARQYQEIARKNKDNPKKKKRSTEDDDDLEILLPSDDEIDTKMKNDNDDEGYDEDAIGDDLFDMMPESDDDWNANNKDEPFGVVEDDTNTQEIEKDEMKAVEEIEAQNTDKDKETQNTKAVVAKVDEVKKKALPLLKSAVNNRSIWPNNNAEYESCEWLDCVIISDDDRCKPMNTNLIIDLNDARMRWTEEFIKNMTKYSEKAQQQRNDEEAKDDDDDASEEDETVALSRKYGAKKWNLSNDDQYTFRDISFAQKRNLHTPMAYNLHVSIFPQVLSIDAWVALHREPIKLGAIKIRLSSKEGEAQKRYKERMDDITNKYSMYIPKNWRELSAVSDRIILLEYLEENPLIIQAVGMSSNITTFYRRGTESNNNNSAETDINICDIKVEDGTVKFLGLKERSPLLGAPRAKKWVTAVENKLYVAPIRSHSLKNNLFLLVGSASGHTYYVRRIDAMFTVGQIQPKRVVYHPGCRKVRSYIHDRTRVQIYRMFGERDRVSVADVLKEYTLDSEDAIKETLRTVAHHDKSIAGGYWVRTSDFLAARSEFEIQQMVSPEQEVLRRMYMNCYCRLYNAGIAGELVGSNRGGSWKRVLKNLVFNRDLLQILDEMKVELEKEKKKWKEEEEIVVTADINPSLRLKALTLIEELLFCTSWYLSDQFLRCFRGEGEMRLFGYGNPFKKGQGFDYLRDRNKTSSEAIKLMVASAGSRANTKADFRRMPMPKALQILKQRYLVPEIVLDKLDRRKIIELLQKKSREALSAGSQNKIALRYARLTGSRKTFARNQYLKKIRRLMKQHLKMLRGSTQSSYKKATDNNDDDAEGINNLEEDLMADLEHLMEEEEVEIKEKEEELKKKKKKLKLITKYKLVYTYCYNDAITGERKREIEEYTQENDSEIFRKYHKCIQEKDVQFTRLREYSKLYQMKMEMMQEENNNNGDKKKNLDAKTAFMSDKQRQTYEKMQRIKNMPAEEREEYLSKYEVEKPYITCSSCKRKGHNSNNKYCPKYHENREKKLLQQANNNREGDHDDSNAMDPFVDHRIDSFIERAIDKKHKSYRGKNRANERANRKKRVLKKDSNLWSDKIRDPRLTFIGVLHHVMQRALDVNGSLTFKTDPSSLAGYLVRIREPMCLDWIHDNISYTEQCIKAPYIQQLTENGQISIDEGNDFGFNPAKITRKRGANKPEKKEYKDFKSFFDDIKLIHSNSVKYNGPNSNFTALAWTIVEEVRECEHRYRDTIKKLNREVNATYKTFDLQPILNELINGILDAPTLDAIKSMKSRSERNGVLGLYEIRQKVHDKHYQNFAEFVQDLKKLQQFCYDANKPQEFETPMKIFPTQFHNKLKQFKQSLKKIDPDSVNHFRLNKKPPFI